MPSKSQVSLFPKGVYTVLVTPFNEDESIDYRSIDEWVDEQQSSAVAGLVLLGTTSESPTLTRDEQYEIVKRVWQRVNGFTSPKFIVAGVGGNNTNETLEFAKLITSEKLCNGLMVTVPSYNKPTQKGIFEHFVKICTHEGVNNFPVIMYNVPGRTSVNMEPKTIHDVVNACKNVVAIKEASGSIDQLIEIMSSVPALQVFAGDDKLVLDVMVHGGCGVISVASNVIPHLMSTLVNLCVTNEFSVASTLYYNSKLPQFIKLLFCETNPIPVKYMLHHKGIYPNFVMRLPMTQLSENKRHDVSLTTAEIISFEDSFCQVYDS